MTPSSVSGFYRLRQAGFETIAQCGTMSPWQDWGWDGVPDCTRLPSMELFHWLQGLQTSVCLQPGAAATQSTPVNPYLVLGFMGVTWGHGAARAHRSASTAGVPHCWQHATIPGQSVLTQSCSRVLSAALEICGNAVDIFLGHALSDLPSCAGEQV